MSRFDIAIIGAGMAGASLAAAIGGAARVLMIEAEAAPGYHATGRSAAFWSETYGGAAVQPLTTASKPMLEARNVLSPRGAITIARTGANRLLDAMEREFAGSRLRIDRVDRSILLETIPGLKPGWDAGLSEPSTRDIDVAALHAAYLGEAKTAGAELMCDAEVTGLMRDRARWRIETRSGMVEAGIVVNAAGAWASGIARMAGASSIAVTPYRRTMLQIVVKPEVPQHLPLILDAEHNFYFKPSTGGRLWLSPHDETPVLPCDAAPEELDVALAIDRLRQVVDWRIERVERKWAGLRSFCTDRVPVYGFDSKTRGFFWFAGQGGFGIQTAPAAAAIGASLILGASLPPPVERVDIARYRPDRF